MKEIATYKMKYVSMQAYKVKQWAPAGRLIGNIIGMKEKRTGSV